MKLSMSEINQERALVTHLQEICARRGIQWNAFSDDWIFCLQIGQRITYIIGYDFSLNSAAAKMICKDKAATSDLLGFHGVAHIEHRLFHGPQLAGYVEESGQWQEMLTYLAAHPQGVVCKPNEGTSGANVFFVRTPGRLEAAVYQLFAHARSLCFSPFEEIAEEYRVALVGDAIEFIYRKVRPSLLGDGARTTRELLLDQLRAGEDFAKQMELMKRLPEMKIDWNYVPSRGESVNINWRHNLGQGSKAELLTPLDPPWHTVGELAMRAVQVLGIQLASVDIVSTPSGLKVLEINSGIMMESLVRDHPEGWAMAGKFYDRIVCLALGIDL